MLNNNFVTIGYLKSFTKGILRISQIGSNLQDDYKVTYDEIIKGLYFNYFKYDESKPKSAVDGLYIEYKDETTDYVDIKDLKLIFTKLKSLSVKCENEYISPCGGSVNLDTIANIDLMQRHINGETLYKKIEYEVNPILRSQNKDFKIEKHSIIIDANLSENTRSTIITASYSFKGKVYNSSIEIIQKSNEVSDWIFKKNITDSISIKTPTTIFPNKGGSIELKIERTFTTIYSKVDSCGNEVATSATTRKS